MLEVAQRVAGEEVITGDLDIVVGVGGGDDGHGDHGVPFLQLPEGGVESEVGDAEIEGVSDGFKELRGIDGGHELKDLSIDS